MPTGCVADTSVMGLFRAIKAAWSGRQASESTDAEAGPSTQGPTESGAPNAAPVRPGSILFVEVDPAVRVQLATCLSELAPAWPSQVVATADEGMKALAAGRFDGVAASFCLDDTSGLEFLRKASEVAPESVFFLQAN